MANDLNVRVGADIQPLQDGMNKAVDTMETFEHQVEDTNKTIEETLKDTKTLRQEQRAAMVQVQKLTAAYAKLSDAERQGKVGQEMAIQLQQAEQKAADLIDATGDLSTKLRNMASDTKNLDALKDGFELVGNAATSILSGLAAVTGKQEDFNKALAVFATVQSTVNTLTKIANVLQPQSSLMIKLNELATRRNTAAKTANAAATVAQTNAQKNLNRVLSIGTKIGYASIVLAVAYAVYKYIDSIKEAKVQTEAQKEALERSKQAIKTYEQSLSSSYSSSMTKYAQLKAAYESLTSTHKRTEWIKNNKEAFKELGLSVTDVKSAEDVFHNNTDKIVDGFKRRAEAAALAAKMTELYRQQMDIEEKARKRLAKLNVQEYDKIKERPSVIKKDTGSDTYNEGKYKMNQKGELYYTEKGAEEYNKQLFTADQQLKDMNSEYKEINNSIDDTTKKMSQLGDVINSTAKGSSSTTTKTLTYAKEKANIEKEYNNKLIDEISYKEKIYNLEKSHYEALVKAGKATQADLDRYKNAKLSYEQIKISTQYQQDLNNAQTEYEHGILKEAEYLEKVAGIHKSIYESNLKNNTATAELAQNYLKAKKAAKDASDATKTLKESLEKQLSDIEKKLTSDNLSVEVRTKLMQDANSIQAQIDKLASNADLTIPAKIEPKYIVKGSIEDVKQSIQNGMQQINSIVEEYDLGIIDYDTATDRIKEINKQLIALGSKPYTVEIESKFGKNLQSIIDGTSKFTGTISSVDNVVNSFDRLSSTVKEGASGWEQFMTAANAAMSVMEAVGTVTKLLTTVQSAFNVVSNATTNTKSEEAVASSYAASAQTAQVASTEALAAANTTAIVPMLALATATKKLAAAQIFQAHASIPFAGPPAAVAGVAAMEATLKSIQAFAEGGIVRGNSYHNDRILARVNSGEMILNDRQQSNLFKLLDSGFSRTSDLIPQIKIKGSDMYIMFKNYSNTQSKLGKNIGIH